METVGPRQRVLSGRRLLLVAGGLVGVAFVGLLMAPGSRLSAMPRLADPGAALGTFSTVFLGILFEALPFLLLGVLVSATLHLFVDAATVVRLTPRHPLAAALTGTMLSFAIPVCECGVVPVCRRLIHKGAPLPLAMAMLLSAPVLNPVVLLSTWVAFGGDLFMVGWRAGLSFVIAVVVGLVFATHRQPHALLAGTQSSANAAPDMHQHEHDHHGQRPGERTRALVWHSSAEFVEMSRYLIVGALLAAALQTLVPRAALLDLGDTPVTAVLVMMGLAVILSVCSTVDAFIALPFAGAFGAGPVLAFLVFGPMVDIKSTALYLGLFRRRSVAILILLVFQMVFLATLTISYSTNR
jgi:uncharacterized membrane protein YraQ (UPF0718 family)